MFLRSQGSIRAGLYIATFASSLTCFSAMLTSSALAVEAGFGVYLLGTKGPGAGIVPPEGFYISSQQFNYHGHYSGPFSPAPGVRGDADIHVDTSFNMLSPVWISESKLLGGRVGVSATVPLGNVDVTLDALGTRTSDSRFSIGDPLVSIFSGWSSNNFYWNAGATFVAPIGQYDPARLSNLALNRPAVDVFAALTWREPNLGLDISGALGVTFNGENDATKYNNGHEFHSEWAISKALSPQVSIGAMGYHYEQLTPDSGPGARLGGFEGRVTAIGAFVNYAFIFDDRAVSLRLQTMEEFNIKNRFEGLPVALNVVVAFGK